MRAQEESAMLGHIGWLAWALALLTLATARDFVVDPLDSSANLADNLLGATRQAAL